MFRVAAIALAILTLVALAPAQEDLRHRRHGYRPPNCVPEPASMIGLGIAGLGLLRARVKKSRV